jgi:hypothetical protein
MYDDPVERTKVDVTPIRLDLMRADSTTRFRHRARREASPACPAAAAQMRSSADWCWKVVPPPDRDWAQGTVKSKNFK